MSSEPKDPERLQVTLEEMIRLFRSPEWKHWLKFQEERREVLQVRINQNVGQGLVRESEIALALMRDTEKQIELFKQRFKDLEKQMATGGK